MDEKLQAAETAREQAEQRAAEALEQGARGPPGPDHASGCPAGALCASGGHGSGHRGDPDGRGWFRDRRGAAGAAAAVQVTEPGRRCRAG
jgi:hypothetical protein